MERKLLQSLPNYLWDECYFASIYILNRSPTTLNGITPYEAWCQRKLDIKHLNIIGCIAYFDFNNSK